MSIKMNKIHFEYLNDGNYTKNNSKPKIWKRFDVIINNNQLGELYVEPKDYLKRYRFYFQNGKLISTKSIKELKEIINKNLESIIK